MITPVCSSAASLAGNELLKSCKMWSSINEEKRMPSERVNTLIGKLSKGLEKSQSIFNSLSTSQWVEPISDHPGAWNMKELLAHFISTERQLLEIAQDIAEGGDGAPEGVDIDAFNQRETRRLRDQPSSEMMAHLNEVRARTIAWVRDLNDRTLDREGRHPTLEIVNVETVVFSIYAHQLLHMREIGGKFRSRSNRNT